jgi:hypothetical protein
VVLVAVVLAQPALAAKACPAASAAASDCWVSSYVPLSTMARWNSPRAPGETSWASVDRPPADSPNRVTSPGSPPKPPMLRCTQRSAACWSIRP